eukprot:TRINITY_DN74016_c0_g1_i1.p1 TRINITY_DN74016_c0_g1~~TRINITY_DN74016_c0_g1_i1.p1  ORF type:complete len:863 (-),score=192.32 TRINITY_DN74016_c0_g1_i1:128-2683(-)
MATTAPLPREIIKWLQSLDLSYSVKNPKRDLTNGYLVAEIFSRYYPKDIDILTYENGSRLEAKIDNWEQIYKVFLKNNVKITKEDFNPVIHCAPGAAVLFLFKVYQALTNRTVKLHGPVQELKDLDMADKPAFMRDTASKRLKDHEIARIPDNVERTIAAIETLGYFHQERRHLKATEAPALIRQERMLKNGQRQEVDTSKEEQVESVQVDEVKVKALQTNSSQQRDETQKEVAPPSIPKSSRSQLVKAVCETQSATGALSNLQAPTAVKPATDIMRPLVYSIVQESEELSKMIDTQKQDIVVAFMEQCREGVRDAGRDATNRAASQGVLPVEQRMREIEETSVKIFETLAGRANLLVDTLTKSPPEFWKVWTTFYPALTDFSESSPIFESAVFFFKRLGELMRENDPGLTQQLITEVGLPSLAKELARAPEKREALCEIIYSFTQPDTINHLLALRALKEKVGDNLPVYVSCLASLISIDAQVGLLDEHLLDLYIYYALVAIQSSQPRVRVAGIAILSIITTQTQHYQSVVALIPNLTALAGDEWWEVQAQLLRLAASLLGKLSPQDRQEITFGGDDDEGSASAASKAGDPSPMEAESAIDTLLGIISRLFDVNNSKNVLQVGLSALVHLLAGYPDLFPMFVTVLLEQRPALRQRLLQPAHEGSERTRLTYVHGNFSRMYEETCLPSVWPHLDVAKTLAMQLEASQPERLELGHIEVLLASLPESFEESEAEEWLQMFEKVKQYIFIALVDPELHLHSTQIIKKFWVCPVEKIATKSIEKSKRTLTQALRLLYSSGSKTVVQEASVLRFLRDLREQGGEVQIEVDSAVDLFKETHPDEYAMSQLDTIFDD